MPLCIFGAAAALTAELEHGWFRAPFAIGTLIRAIVLAVFTVLVMSGFGYYVWPSENDFASGDVGFHVRFKMQFLDMSRQLNAAPFWALYWSSYGRTVAPIALLEYLEVTSQFSHEIGISRYHMELNSDKCGGWIMLSNIDPRSVQVLFDGVSKGVLQNAGLLNILPSDTFAAIWDQPMPPQRRQAGFMFFDTPTSCDLDFGDEVRFRLTMIDSNDKSYTYTSAPSVIARTLDEPDEVHRPTLNFPGWDVDASAAYRRIYSDPMPSKIPSNELNSGAVTFKNVRSSRNVQLTDGTFICDCSRPPKPPS